MRECGRQNRLPLAPPASKMRAHARRLTDADRADIGLDELHRVVDGQARRHDTTGRIDVQVNVLVRILGLEEQQLGDHEIGHVILDRTDNEDDALLQQPRVDVVSAFAAGSLLDDHRHESECPGFHSHVYCPCRF